MNPRSYFPQHARDKLLGGIDDLLEAAYKAGLQDAAEAAGSVGIRDLDPPKDERGVILPAYWEGRHASRDAIRQLIDRQTHHMLKF